MSTGWKNILLVTGALIFWWMFTELCLRWLAGDHLTIPNQSLSNAAFQYDVELGWKGVPDVTGQYAGTRTITFLTNELGFRDRTLPDNSKPNLLFVGDSFTWGFDVEQEERFTNLLAEELQGWNVVNSGVNGYGTDQTFLSLKRNMDQLNPKAVVLLYFSENDRVDNSTNTRHGGYYKPYMMLRDSTLITEGIPVPKGQAFVYSTYPWLRFSYLARMGVNAWSANTLPPKIGIEDPTNPIFQEMNRYLSKYSIPFFVAYQGVDSTLINMLDSEDIPHLNVTNTHRYEALGGHWTPEGHKQVAEYLSTFLKTHNID
ncbi:MAG: hypothetical protein AAFW89_12645 [Bacteroidota bacterium]